MFLEWRHVITGQKAIGILPIELSLRLAQQQWYTLCLQTFFHLDGSVKSDFTQGTISQGPAMYGFSIDTHSFHLSTMLSIRSKSK